MPGCAKCGESLSRTHRKGWEKLLFSIVFKCRTCGSRVGEKYRFMNYFSPHTKCPRCGTEELEKRNTRDKIDKVIHTPMSVAQMALGGSLYHCVFCRIQFYDIRNRSRRAQQPSRVIHPLRDSFQR